MSYYDMWLLRRDNFIDCEGELSPVYADLPEWFGALETEPVPDRLETEFFINRLCALSVSDQAIILYMIDRLSGEPAPEYEVQAIVTEDGREGTIHYTWSDNNCHAGNMTRDIPRAPFPSPHRRVIQTAAHILGSLPE